MSEDLILTDIELRGRSTDVRVSAGIVTEIGDLNRLPGERAIPGRGRALIPGLHDHHCHLLAAAAALTSVDCGPPSVTNRAGLVAALRNAPTVDGWIRGVGYDEDVAGPLDASGLDRLMPSVPTRIQHRSGALWILNTAAMTRLGLQGVELPGVERDTSGQATGRLWRLDDWLREQVGGTTPDVAKLSSMLAARGVTGVTDASPNLRSDAVQAIVDGGLLQRLVTLGEPHDRARLGPRKLVVSDHRLPSLEELLAEILAARPRAVAVHCVTRAALGLTLAALSEAGSRTGDRIEHAAVCPPELARGIAQLHLTVVTQPSMIARRGDDYSTRVDADDLPYLWPFASLKAAGIGVGCSSDAPYGDGDPWESVATAVERRTRSGRVVAYAERVPALTALQGYLSAPEAPGGPPRQIAPGEPADLCLLDRTLQDALAQPREVEVVLTMVGGEVVHDARAAYT